MTKQLFHQNNVIIHVGGHFDAPSSCTRTKRKPRKKSVAANDFQRADKLNAASQRGIIRNTYDENKIQKIRGRMCELFIQTHKTPIPNNEVNIFSTKFESS